MTASNYLNTVTLAAELDVATPTVRRWQRTGEGPAFIRVGRQIRYTRAAVDAWLASRTVGAAS